MVSTSYQQYPWTWDLEPHSPEPPALSSSSTARQAQGIGNRAENALDPPDSTLQVQSCPPHSLRPPELLPSSCDLPLSHPVQEVERDHLQAEEGPVHEEVDEVDELLHLMHQTRPPDFKTFKNILQVRKLGTFEDRFLLFPFQAQVCNIPVADNKSDAVAEPVRPKTTTTDLYRPPDVSGQLQEDETVYSKCHQVNTSYDPDMNRLVLCHFRAPIGIPTTSTSQSSRTATRISATQATSVQLLTHLSAAHPLAELPHSLHHARPPDTTQFLSKAASVTSRPTHAVYIMLGPVALWCPARLGHFQGNKGRKSSLVIDTVSRTHQQLSQVAMTDATVVFTNILHLSHQPVDKLLLVFHFTRPPDCKAGIFGIILQGTIVRHTCCVYTLKAHHQTLSVKEWVTSILTHLSIIQPMAELRPLTLTSLSPELFACITSRHTFDNSFMSQSFLINLSCLGYQTMVQSCLDFSSSKDLTAAFAQVAR